MSDTKVDAQFWLDRWKSGETRWHQNEVEEQLVLHFSSLKPTQVLVPLCGKTMDMAWLASRGHSVVGVELSELAIRSFFEEHRIPNKVLKTPEFQIFSGKGVTIYHGDFFQLASAMISPLGAVYDRAALIALPPELRVAYSRKIIELAGTGGSAFRMLLLAHHREPTDGNGPPYSVPESEIRSLYGSRFTIEAVDRELVPSDVPESFTRHQTSYLML